MLHSPPTARPEKSGCQMAEFSNIAWTDHTHNHWIGCTKVSPGCDHCYAEAWNKRFDGGKNWGPGAPRRLTAAANRFKPLRWQRDAEKAGIRPRVFASSLSDVFDNEVPDQWRTDLFDIMWRTPMLDWIVVTKRVGNVAKMAPKGTLPPNVILLSTIVNQTEANRDLPKLVALKKSGVVRKIGVSYEPALGPVDWSPWISDLDWLIVGGESAQGGAAARDFPVNWAYRAIYTAAGTGCAVFIKQIGSSPKGLSPLDKLSLRDRASADPTEWPADLRVRQFPIIG